MANKPAKAAVASVNRIALERPASVRRLLPELSDGWVLPEYFVGPENATLQFLFDDEQIPSLAARSPILLYGDKHLGKTALAITLAVRWSRKINQRPLCFTTGSSFATDFAAAVEIDDVASFRRRMRECKMLVIDHLDPLAAKPAAQDELVATLDYLLEHNRPVVVSIGRLPSTLRGIKTALASRLSGGYSVGLAKPAAETRDELVLAFIDSINHLLPRQELLELVQLISKEKPLSACNLRDIVTIAHHNLAMGELDVATVGKLARQHLSNDSPTIPSIAKLVAKRFRVKLIDLRSSTRQASVVRARGLAMLLSRQMTSASLLEIGKFFGGRDHSTVLHACRRTSGLLDTDSSLANYARDIRSEILNA